MKLKKENCTKFQGVVVNLIDFDLQNNISRSGYGKNFFFNVSKTRSNFYNFLKKNIFTFPLRDVHTIIFKKKKKRNELTTVNQVFGNSTIRNVPALYFVIRETEILITTDARLNSVRTRI